MSGYTPSFERPPFADECDSVDEFDAIMQAIRYENNLRFAYIAGVGKGIEMAQESWSKDEFHDEIRESFAGYVEEHNG